jgi:Ca2+:H+ antiporter
MEGWGMATKGEQSPLGFRSLFRAENVLSLFLIFVPVAVGARYLHWGGLAVFAFSCLAIIPLAGLMGKSTEQLAERLGAGVGGLLNATFGNAAELIIAMVALNAGKYSVVKASLTGSIIGNILLVLGLATLLGGIRRERQAFDRTAAGMGCTLLTLAVIGLVVPALFHMSVLMAISQGKVDAGTGSVLEHEMSLYISLVLFAAYILSLLFSLGTHKTHYAGNSHGAHAVETSGKVGKALSILLIATVLVAWMSELLVGAVEEASHTLGFTEVFVGVIVVAVIGNAAEHSTAVLAAMKNHMDLALNIAVGSSTQVALFVAPVLVFASYFMPHGPMDLMFTGFEVLAVALAVGIVNIAAQDGESNWLEGALLLAVYAILGIAFFFLPETLG